MTLFHAALALVVALILNLIFMRYNIKRGSKKIIIVMNVAGAFGSLAGFVIVLLLMFTSK